MALSSTIGGTGTIGGKSYTTISKNTGGNITSSKGSSQSSYGSSGTKPVISGATRYTISSATSNNTKSSSSQSSGFTGTVAQYLAAGGSMPGSSSYTGGSSYVRGDIAGSGLYTRGSTATDTIVYAMDKEKQEMTIFNPDRTTTKLSTNPYNDGLTPIAPVAAVAESSNYTIPLLIGGGALLLYMIFKKKRR